MERLTGCWARGKVGKLGRLHRKAFAVLAKFAASKWQGIAPQGVADSEPVLRRCVSLRNFAKLCVSLRFVAELSVSFRSVPSGSDSLRSVPTSPGLLLGTRFRERGTRSPDGRPIAWCLVPSACLPPYCLVPSAWCLFRLRCWRCSRLKTWKSQELPDHVRFPDAERPAFSTAWPAGPDTQSHRTNSPPGLAENSFGWPRLWGIYIMPLSI